MTFFFSGNNVNNKNNQELLELYDTNFCLILILL